jgi:hypothetical protein
MNWITELLFNAGSGGLFGLVGSLATTFLRLREKKQDNEHAMKMAEVTFKSAEQVESWKAFANSQSASASDMTEKVSPWAANVRAVTRPALTLLLVVAACIVAFRAPPDVQANAIQNIQILAGTAVAWWFGSRMTTQIQPPAQAVPIRKG